MQLISILWIVLAIFSTAFAATVPVVEDTGIVSTDVSLDPMFIVHTLPNPLTKPNSSIANGDSAVNDALDSDRAPWGLESSCRQDESGSNSAGNFSSVQGNCPDLKSFIVVNYHLWECRQ